MSRKFSEIIRIYLISFQSDEATYYIYCPECKARIELNKVKILVDRQQQQNNNNNNNK